VRDIMGEYSVIWRDAAHDMMIDDNMQVEKYQYIFIPTQINKFDSSGGSLFLHLFNLNQDIY
jgi:hypothetical protein